MSHDPTLQFWVPRCVGHKCLAAVLFKNTVLAFGGLLHCLVLAPLSWSPMF